MCGLAQLSVRRCNENAKHVRITNSSQHVLQMSIRPPSAHTISIPDSPTVDADWTRFLRPERFIPIVCFALFFILCVKTFIVVNDLHITQSL